MKKTLTVIIMTLLCTTAFAKVKITSGSAAFLKEEATAVIEFDYSEAAWEEDQSYKTWCGEDFNTRVQLSKESFIFAFNKNSKKLKINDGGNDAKYRITFKVENMEQKVGGNWGQFYVRCYGTITVQDIATGETVCTINVNKEGGDTDYVPNDRISSCFSEIGKRVAKL